MGTRRDFGTVRRLASGRWQARAWSEATGRQVSIGSYATKTEARLALASTTTDQARGAWLDPTAGRITLAGYAPRWLDHRPDLRPRTRELYASLLRLHILPTLGPFPLGRVSISVVREWHADLSGAAGPGVSTAAKAYRLLRTILGTAAEDGLIAVNPCTIKRAGQERSPKRPLVAISDVFALADAIGPELRCLVLLAAFCGLRRGELLALRRRHLDPLHGTLTVAEQTQRLAGGVVISGPPKTAAGVRTVTIPGPVLVDVIAHLATGVGSAADALVFTGQKGGPLSEPMLQTRWNRARRAAQLPHVHLHDLRHHAGTLAAATGASTAELMARLGHSSPAAALRYQHATRDRDEAIASIMGDLIEQNRTSPSADVVDIATARRFV